MNTQSPTLFILKSAPYSSSLFEEGVDALFAYAAFGQPVNVLLMGSAVNALRNAQSRGYKNAYKLLESLEMYDVETIFYCMQSARDAHFNAQPPEFSQGLNTKEINTMINLSRIVFSF